ncbi:MAG: hypothetical protein HQ521_00750 [Bacteroidetes bacterium]|nr:hypothetical protein [Bacteroidota bacterium]
MDAFQFDYKAYYHENKLNELLKTNYVQTKLYKPGFVFDIDGKDPFAPDCDDLVRLHHIIRSRKVMTVLEFGVGWSTAVMADALYKNHVDYADKIKNTLRRVDPFTLYTVDTEKKYIDITENNLPDHLRPHVEFLTTSAYLTTFNGRICGRLEKLPNICPDFVYSDGPSFRSIKGDVNGISMDHQDRTIITSDLLMMEPLFLPGTLILFDGQTNNARFHKNNFQRNWKYKHLKKEDISVFELIEEPLGPYNELQLKFQNILD